MVWRDVGCLLSGRSETGYQYIERMELGDGVGQRGGVWINFSHFIFPTAIEFQLRDNSKSTILCDSSYYLIFPHTTEYILPFTSLLTSFQNTITKLKNMERSFQIKCVNGHVALQVCTEKQCQHPSGICSQKNCECSKRHSGCFNSFQVSTLVSSLQKCARQNSEQLDEIVLGPVNKMMKRLQTIKIEYQNMFDQQYKYLWGNKKKLYEFLEKGSAEELQPKFVAMVIEELGQGSKSKDEVGRRNQMLQLMESMNTMQKQQEISIKVIRKWWKQLNIETKFYFRKDLTNSSVEISKQGQKAKHIGTDCGMYSYSLLSPSVFESNSSKVRIKIVKCMGICQIGVAEEEPLSKIDFGYSSNSKGKNTIQNTGYITNLSNSHPKNLSAFKFGSGDMLEMEYQEAFQYLVFRNLTKKTQYTLDDIHDWNKDLHYCVSSSCEDDEWEIVE